MSGITGIYSFTNTAQHYENSFNQSLAQIATRGKRLQTNNSFAKIFFGQSFHTAPSPTFQPVITNNQRYAIVFDGEFYNYRSFIEAQTERFDDVEQQKLAVLLQLYVRYGVDFVNKIDGFFSLAIFDNQEQTLFVARDAIGGKPLYFFKNDDFFCFCSELNGALSYPIPRKINQTALFSYLQLHYIPAPESIVEQVFKLKPGTFILLSPTIFEQREFAHSEEYSNPTINYARAQIRFPTLLENALEKRIAETPSIASFLSGGIDSSIVSALAAQRIKKLPTFSIGFTENPYFDESKYAELMSKKIGSEHTTLQISQAECSEHIFDILESFDEPFADSSAIAMYILSEKTASHYPVALSGDGADELFGGYRKHAAHLRLLSPSFSNNVLKTARPLLQILPQSRNSKLLDIFRKANRYAQALSLSNADAYWRLCCVQNEKQAQEFLLKACNKTEYEYLKNAYCSQLNGKISLNDILLADQKLVLANDMMTKTDRMSIRHGLEVRTPFLDKTIISFANSLPVDYKIHNSVRKRIVKDSFASLLPAELINRPKHGFEVPLHTWCCTILSETIDKLLSKEFIAEQNIFNWNSIAHLREKLQSSNPGDAAAQIWTLLVFQSWWKKYMI